MWVLNHNLSCYDFDQGKDIHKKHHEFKVTVGIAAEYSHPVWTIRILLQNDISFKRLNKFWQMGFLPVLAHYSSDVVRSRRRKWKPSILLYINYCFLVCFRYLCSCWLVGDSGDRDRWCAQRLRVSLLALPSSLQAPRWCSEVLFYKIIKTY